MYASLSLAFIYQTHIKTTLQHLQEMLRNAYFVKLLPFRTVLIDSWYASRRVMKAIQGIGKIYYAPLRCNRLVKELKDFPLTYLQGLVFHNCHFPRIKVRVNLS